MKEKTMSKDKKGIPFFSETIEGKIGIYQIINRHNGNAYIGKSVHLAKRRVEHYSYLKNKKHHNPHLQNAFYLYGAHNFLFSVIEYVDNSDDLDDLETYWIDVLKPEYNILLNGDNYPGKKDKKNISPREDEQFDRPPWQKFVYGSEQNPIHQSR